MQVNGAADATANDYLFPNPMIGVNIFDYEVGTLVNFVPGLLGADFGAVMLVHAQEGTPHQPPGVSALIGSRAFINGNNSSTIKVKWKNTGRTFAVTDGHYAEIHSSLNVSVDLEVAGVAPGTEVIVYWYFNVFAGGSTEHDGMPPVEDPIMVVSSLEIDNVNQFPNNEFNFGLPGLPGWREWNGVTGNIQATAGQPFNVEISSQIDLWLAEPPELPVGGFGVDKNDGTYKGEIVFSVSPLLPDPINNVQEDMLPLFSVDIGSDTEVSDIIQGNGNEVFDPGDLYAQYSGPPLPVVTPWKDDATIFGADPDPGTTMPINAAPLQSGDPIDLLSSMFFDLDGSDCIQLDLSDSTLFIPGSSSIPWSSDSCIFNSEYLFLSFDDDIAENYAAPMPSIPFNSFSPLSSRIYSESGIRDEVMEFDYDIFVPATAVFTDSSYSEHTLHGNLDPDPILSNELDDDIDALDMIPVYNGQSPCTNWYFSADHEALFFDPVTGTTLSPSDIYQVVPGGIMAVITSSHHALPAGTDIDAFEFAWVWDTVAVRLGLALIFSVDDDDPLTPDDESGGLSPSALYYSFLDSSHHLFSPNALPDDIDGIAVWKHSLNGTLGFPPPVWGTKSWNGTQSTHWHNALNWFPRGVPFFPENVFIPNVPTLPIITTNGHDCHSVEVQPGASLKLVPGVRLDVRN